MPDSAKLLRRLFGPSRTNIQPLILAVELTEKLLFERGDSLDDLLITKHIYPDVAKQLHKKPGTVAKSMLAYGKVSPYVVL